MTKLRKKLNLARELTGRKTTAALVLDALLSAAALFFVYFTVLSRRAGKIGGAVSAAVAVAFTAALCGLLFSCRLERFEREREAAQSRESAARRALLCNPEALLRFAAKTRGLEGEYSGGLLVCGGTLCALLRLFPNAAASPGAILRVRDEAVSRGCQSVVLFCTSKYSKDALSLTSELDVGIEPVSADALLSLDGLENVLPPDAARPAPPERERFRLRDALGKSAAGYVRCALLIASARLLFGTRPSGLGAYYTLTALLCLAAAFASAVIKKKKT